MESRDRGNPAQSMSTGAGRVDPSREPHSISIGVPAPSNVTNTFYTDLNTTRLHSDAIGPAWQSSGSGRGNLPPAQTPNGKGRIDFVRLALAFLRRWIPAAIIGSIVGIVTGIIAWVVIAPAKYTATARLYVAAVQPTFMYKTREMTTDYAMFRQTQLALLKSQQVIEAALRACDDVRLKSFTAMGDPAEWLREQLSVSFASGSEVLEIALSGDDPVMVATLVNAAVTAYLDEVVNVDHVERQRRLEGLKGIWKKYESDLRRKREQLRAIAEAIGSDDKKALTLQKQYEVDRQDLVRRNLIEVHGELLKRRAELEFAGERNERVLNGPGRKASEEAIEAELLNDPAIARHLENISKYKEEIMQQSRIVRNPGTDPGISSIRTKMRDEELALRKRRKAIRPFIASQLLNVTVTDQGTSGNIEALRDQVAMLERLESQYQHELQSIKEETRKFYGKSFDFGLLQDEVELDQKAAREVGDELRHVELELNQAPPRIKTFEKAKVPRVKDQGRKIKISVLSGAAAFLLIVVAVTLWEYQAQRVGFAHDVVQTTGMGVVGTLPALASRSRENLALGRNSAALLRTDLLLESIDITRLMLIRATQAESLRVVMIASAVSGEGKTSLASLLAASLSRSGRRTLLLDSDIRKPNLHQIFEAPLAPGLCEYLRGEVELSAGFWPTPVGNLALMSAGNMDDKALTLLAQRDLRPMFKTLRNEFDFVIVDSSPVLSVADPLVVGLHVDAVVFAVMNDVSRIPDVFKAHNRLISLGIRVLGAVVAGTREGLSSSVYAYRYPRNKRDIVA